jgi:long-subunit fatty acid transport protein
MFIPLKTIGVATGIITLSLATGLLPPCARAQLVIGQYEQEAPLRTWNAFGFESASALGRGGASFTLAEDCSAALVNPALLADLPGLTLTINGALSYASLFKYSLINTGVLSTEGNLSLNSLALDFGGVSIQAGDWFFGLSAALSEVYDRPGVNYEYSSQGRVVYSLDFAQTGFLRTINFSLARRLGSLLKAGLGINYAAGDLKRETVEEYHQTGITISDRKEQRFSGLYVNGGISVALTPQLNLALVFRSPYVRKSDSRSDLRYAAPAGGTDIRIEAESADRCKRPLVIGMGAKWQISTRLLILADLAYFNWSKYEVESFGETQERNFNDTFRAGAGAEYSVELSFFDAPASLPVRVGIGYDRQPMSEPDSAYTLYSLGTGLHWRMIGLDAGASFGQESGSGRSLAARRFAVSLSVRL